MTKLGQRANYYNHGQPDCSIASPIFSGWLIGIFYIIFGKTLLSHERFLFFFFQLFFPSSEHWCVGLFGSLSELHT